MIALAPFFATSFLALYKRLATILKHHLFERGEQPCATEDHAQFYLKRLQRNYTQ
jgi:hypothetical protein